MVPTTHFHAVLRARISAYALTRSDDLSQGIAKDYPDYLRAVGLIEGLKIALQFCEDIEREMDV
jgi:hypothetical protein